MENIKIVRKIKKNDGFTLIEVIATIIIIGILAIITIPAISKYINSTRNTTYGAHEKSMEEAANSMMIDCINNNTCDLPDTGEKSLIYLNELTENGYLEALKSTDGKSNCNEILSYVEIENTGNANYEYKACLYCGDYVTDDNVCTKYVADPEKPTCGIITGESTQWTNKDRTIIVGCNDQTSGCLKSEFSKTFRETTEKGVVEIADKSGNSEECPVDVYVDKDLPTCELKVVKGTLESTGWYSGEVEVELISTSDQTSGVLTYGIGTSVNNKNYNKQTLITDLKQGTTTVIGYVKDYAGNEGICSLDVRVGIPRPTFELEYGYQIYPNKESYTTNMTENGTIFTSKNTDPTISFTGLEEYIDVNRLVVYFNTAIPTTTTGQVFYSNSTYSEANSYRTLLVAGQTKAEFLIPKGTYKNIRLDLGDLSGKSYNIKRIELWVGNTSELFTNKNVTINVIPTNEIVKATEFSFDNGVTWQSSNSKEFSANYTGSVLSRNKLPLTSDPVVAIIKNIDKDLPTCVLKADGTKNAQGVFSTDAIVSFASATDKDATSGNVKSGVRTYKIEGTNSTSIVHSISGPSEKTYTGYIEDKAGNSSKCSITVKSDASPPTVTYSVAGGTYGTTKSITITPKDEGSGVSYYNIHVYKNGSIINQYNNLTSANYTVNLSSEGSYTVYTYVIDKAGNKIVQTPNNGSNWYYQNYVIDLSPPTVTYSVAGGVYGGAIGILITPKDSISGVNYYNIHVYKNGTILNAYNSLKSTNYTVNLTSEGTYTVYTQVFDKVGNKIVQAPNNGGNWYYQTYVLDFHVPTCTTSKTNTGSESGVTINWSCSDSGSGLKSVTLGGTAVGASGSLAGQKATVNLVAVDNAGRTGTYTVQVTSEGGCDTFCANYCCNDYWCGKGACCSSYRCPYECGFVGRCWTKYY